MKLTDTEVEVLQRAPVAIFMLVAGADGSRSANEKNAYLLTWRQQVDADQHGPMSSDPRHEQVWQWLFTADTDVYQTMSVMDDESLWDIVSSAGDILRSLNAKCDVTEVENIVRSFIALARAVASAPTMTLVGMALGKSVSEEENTAIRKVVRLLRVEKSAAA